MVLQVKAEKEKQSTHAWCGLCTRLPVTCLVNRSPNDPSITQPTCRGRVVETRLRQNLNPDRPGTGSSCHLLPHDDSTSFTSFLAPTNSQSKPAPAAGSGPNICAGLRARLCR